MTYLEQDMVNVLSPNLVQHSLQHSTHDNKLSKICVLVSISLYVMDFSFSKFNRKQNILIVQTEIIN